MHFDERAAKLLKPKPVNPAQYKSHPVRRKTQTDSGIAIARNIGDRLHSIWLRHRRCSTPAQSA
jgi:hypothetical protein